jgi:hypothetical protein
LTDQSPSSDPQRGEAVLDLTMATNNLYRRARVEACVDERYACGSDHEPILTCIFGTQASQGGKRLGRYSMEKLDPEEFNLTWNANDEGLERLKDHKARREWKLLKYIEALEPDLRTGRNDSKRNLAKTIKKARDDFFRKIISELNKSTKLPSG